jgi:hypothetical protein
LGEGAKTETRPSARLVKAEWRNAPPHPRTLPLTGEEADQFPRPLGDG